MALGDYTAGSTVVTLNGRQITDWGHSAVPFSHEPIDPSRELVRGQGGSAIATGRFNPGRRAVLNLMPGSPDSQYVQSLFRAGVLNLVLNYSIVGSNEWGAGAEGVITIDGTVGRAGQNTNVSDDQFTIEFNKWEGDKGGK